MEKQSYLTTSQLARTLGVQGASIRRGLCLNGHYMGLRPIKLPNNRLMWPEKSVYQLLQSEQGASVDAESANPGQ